MQQDVSDQVQLGKAFEGNAQGGGATCSFSITPVTGERTAFNRGFVRDRYDDAGKTEPPAYLDEKKDRVKNVLRSHLNDVGVKWYLGMKVVFKRDTDFGEQFADPVFVSSTFLLVNLIDFEEQFEEGRAQILETICHFQREGSGWVFDSIVFFDINVAQFNPLAGRKHQDLPKFIQDKKAVLNIVNEDEKCFLWAVLACRHILELTKSHEERGVFFNSNRASHYRPFEGELNMNGIPLPVRIVDIREFELQNPN